MKPILEVQVSVGIIITEFSQIGTEQGKKIILRPTNLGQYGFNEFHLDAYNGRPELMAIDPAKQYKLMIVPIDNERFRQRSGAISDKQLNHGELPYDPYVDIDQVVTFCTDFIDNKPLARITDAEGDLVAYVHQDKADLFIRLFNSYEPSKPTD